MKLLILLAILSGVAALSGPGQANGFLRESVTIQCRYGKDYKDSVKYWCKGQSRISCTTLIRTDALQTNDTISISDNKTEGVFTVTMRELREEDEERYWCGIERTGYDEGISVYLTVNKDMVTGWIQGLVTAQCRYDKGFNDYVKYWSRGTIFKDSTVLVRTDETKTPNRISISDNKTARVFTVTMRDLREEDEGRYRCGIKRSLIQADNGNAVHLTVKGAAALSGPDQVNGLLQESVTIQCRYGKDYKDNVKYWCKGQFRISCNTLIRTDDLQTNDRISIRDNKTEGVFTVTMRQLREEDEGYYCCGIRSKPLSLDEVTSVYLTVNKDMVTGWIQGLVTAQCRYDKGFNDYVKYWSKGRIFKDSTVLVRTDETKTPNRISIRDKKTEGVFTVTMRQLREEDAGRYWCGIKRIGYDEGISVYLTVNKGNRMSYCNDTRYS
ncbi:UNVERIFIED_CONTAM: hypothetical protein FKN15_039306 [Acipenser sinensis]